MRKQFDKFSLNWEVKLGWLKETITLLSWKHNEAHEKGNREGTEFNMHQDAEGRQAAGSSTALIWKSQSRSIIKSFLKRVAQTLLALAAGSCGCPIWQSPWVAVSPSDVIGRVVKQKLKKVWLPASFRAELLVPGWKTTETATESVTEWHTVNGLRCPTGGSMPVEDAVADFQCSRSVLLSL